MRFSSSLRRSDTLAALVVGGSILVVVALQGAGLYAFAAMESLEEADLWMKDALRTIEQEVAQTGSVSTGVDTLRTSFPELRPQVRLLEGARIVSVWGEWPAPGSVVAPKFVDDGRNLAAFRLLRNRNWMVGSTQLASGEVIELALSLSHFAHETAELGGGILLMTIVSGVLAGLVGIGATILAFQPLRRATALLERIDADQLGVQLPSRGTGDLVDRHVAVLNQILNEIHISYQRIRAFSGEAAHELRTPLNRIRNVAEVALIGGDPSEIRAALCGIQDTTEELSEVVQSLLFLAEIDNHQGSLRTEALDLDAWLARCATLYQPLFEEQDVKLVLSSDVGTVMCDRRLLDRLLVNLLENALQHTRSGDTVRIGAQRTDTIASFWVDDSGPGIPRPERERVFEPFLRSATQSTPGHGLGLALAKAIVEFHGGRIRLEDSPLGGARVSWWIPVRSQGCAGKS